MKYCATITNDVEKACWLTWKDVYNIVYSDEKAGYKIMFLETNFMSNTKQPLSNYYWAGKQ